MAVATRRAGNRGQRIVSIPGMPGESIDARILPDVEYLIERFKLKVTDGYSRSSVHAAGGEHPLGLAVDVVPDPRRGGTWDDVDAAVAFVRRHPDVFRWIGYDGVPNHGRGNHAHFSWHGRTGDVKTLTGTGATDDGGGGGFDVPGVTDLAGAAGDAAGAVLGLGGDAAEATAKAIFNFFADYIGEHAAKALLYVALVGGGAAIALVGVSRAVGVRAPSREQLLELGTLAATKGKA